MFLRVHGGLLDLGVTLQCPQEGRLFGATFLDDGNADVEAGVLDVVSLSPHGSRGFLSGQRRQGGRAVVAVGRAVACRAAWPQHSNHVWERRPQEEWAVPAHAQ